MEVVLKKLNEKEIKDAIRASSGGNSPKKVETPGGNFYPHNRAR
jgi:hypothetical protein